MSAPARADTAPMAVPCAAIDVACYDRTPTLSATERAALAVVATRHGCQAGAVRAALARLTAPVADVLDALGSYASHRPVAVATLRRAMHERQVAFWGWSRDEWLATIRAVGRGGGSRHDLLACMYLLGGIADVRADVGVCTLPRFAATLFGDRAVATAIGQVRDELCRWGWTPGGAVRLLPGPVSVLLLLARSPHLAAVTPAVLQAALDGARTTHEATRLHTVARALVGLGVVPHPPASTRPPNPWLDGADLVAGVAPAWAAWARRWHDTATLAPAGRQDTYYALLRVGRWLARAHPGVTVPGDWTRELAAEYVAAVDRLTHGDWVKTPAAPRFAIRAGRPVSAVTKLRHLANMRRFFRDCQEWGWIPRRFDPGRALAAPRSLRAAVGPAPRVIADDVWAKLLWAGLHLAEADLPTGRHADAPWYPLALVRALVVTWLFAGLRWNELARLRLGCVRWQRGEVTVVGTADGLPADAVCWLDVPVNKTMTAFTKPVDRAVGEVIAAWEATRPPQPALVDRKTGEAVHFLFAYRGRCLGGDTLNRTIIPLLCRKAGVPEADARGPITSHRARSTIASQLANAKEPLTLLELQAWLGHRQPTSTLHYVRVAPTRLAKAYADAGYFARNVRAVEVLLDRDAVTSGTAAAGAPWRFYDLGHGYCTYDFFDQCPHRMACARCAFYRPKGSARAQLLEGKANLLRLRQEIPLSDEERAAVDDGLAAHERLLAQLADVPTPAGPTPRELGAGPGDGVLLPAPLPAHTQPLIPLEGLRR